MRKPMTEDEMAREIRRAKRFNDVAFILTVLFAIVVILGLFFFQRHVTFSPKRWQNMPEHRSSMVYSLLSQVQLYGMTEQEVVKLLGYDQHKWDVRSDSQLTYYLGKSSDVHSERWLILELKDGKVSSFQIHTE